MSSAYESFDIWRVEMSRLFAKLAHHGQTRKWTGTPFSDHPIRVSKEVAMMSMRVEAVQAAALHDVKEDSPKFFPLIHEEFGGEVSDLVSWLTRSSKGSKEPRARRKEMDRNHLAIAPLEVKVIKALDRLDNLREMGDAPEDFRFMYAEESRLLVEALNTATPDGSPIYARFQKILKMVLDECNRITLYSALEGAENSDNQTSLLG